MKLAVLAVLVSFVSLILAGCVTQTVTPSPTLQQTPTVTQPPSPSPGFEPTATPSPEPTADLTPQEKLLNFKNSVELVLEEVFGQEFTFSEDANPVNGEKTYFTGGSSNYFDVRVTVARGISKQWPSTKTLAEMKGESGVKKTVAFTQSNPQQPEITTEFDMECNDFAQTASVVLKEKNTGALPFTNLAGNMTSKLIDSCP